jgi:hypothetical protein
MPEGTLEARVNELESKLRRRNLGTGMAWLAVIGLLIVGANDAKPLAQAPARITASQITIVDDQGRQRVVLGQDPKDAQRRSRASGITLYDEKGAERGGFSTMEDGSVVFAMDAPAGIGAPMRDRLGMVVGDAGQASIMLIDNQTRGVAGLYSDGSGGGGLQVYKWDMAGNERAHRRREMVEQHARVAAEEFDAACLLVLPTGVGFDLHGGNGECARQGIVERAARSQRSLVRARPVGDGRD